MIRLAPVSLLVAVFVAGAHIAAAQPIGTFRWQQQPYCNVLTLNVVQQGAVYQLDGYDDLCGAAHRGAASGLAFLNPDGSLGLGVTIVHSGGLTTHLDAVMSLPSVSGQWRDGTGAAGAWTFTPGAPSPGSPRPVARAVFAAGLSAGGATLSNLGSPLAATDAANRQYVDTGFATAVATARHLSTRSGWLNGSDAHSIEGRTFMGGIAPCLRFADAVVGVRFYLTAPVGSRPTHLRLRVVDNDPGDLNISLGRIPWSDTSPPAAVPVLSQSVPLVPLDAHRVVAIPLQPQPVLTADTFYVLAVYGYTPVDLQICGAALDYVAAQ
jgi:hypothetical protein